MHKLNLETDSIIKDDIAATAVTASTAALPQSIRLILPPLVSLSAAFQTCLLPLYQQSLSRHQLAFSCRLIVISSTVYHRHSSVLPPPQPYRGLTIVSSCFLMLLLTQP
jgi:hypothetical protein